jgi:hypothetical protein
MELAVTGAVYNSWSVFCLFSSAITLIVNSGTDTMNKKVMEDKVYSIFVDVWSKLYTPKNNPTIIRNTARKTYPIIDVK